MEFISLAEQKPTQAGPVTFQVEREGMSVLFNSNMRERVLLQPSKRVLSPEFDYWNGYQLILPPDVNWTPDTVELEQGQLIPDQAIHACPFCKQTPKVFYHTTMRNKTPRDTATFHMSCCRMTAGKSKRESSLKKLLIDWNTPLTPQEA